MHKDMIQTLNRHLSSLSTYGNNNGSNKGQQSNNNSAIFNRPRLDIQTRPGRSATTASETSLPHKFQLASSSVSSLADSTNSLIDTQVETSSDDGIVGSCGNLASPRSEHALFHAPSLQSPIVPPITPTSTPNSSSQMLNSSGGATAITTINLPSRNGGNIGAAAGSSKTMTRNFSPFGKKTSKNKKEPSVRSINTAGLAQPKPRWFESIEDEKEREEFLGALSKEEKKRQEVSYEIFMTEEDYIKDLQMTIDVYIKPMSEQKLKTKDLSDIFSNLEQLLPVNQVFTFSILLLLDCVIGC
jgi:hypothetical protein